MWYVQDSLISPRRDLCRLYITDFFLFVDEPKLRFMTSIDISGCVKFDATSLIDLAKCMHVLEFFTYRHCKQFSQYNLQRMADLCPYLRYIDGTGAGVVSATVAYGILGALQHLQKFAVTPNPSEMLQWSGLESTFGSRTIFGACIIEKMRYRGVLTIKQYMWLLKREMQYKQTM